MRVAFPGVWGALGVPRPTHTPSSLDAEIAARLGGSAGPRVSDVVLCEGAVFVQHAAVRSDLLRRHWTWRRRRGRGRLPWPLHRALSSIHVPESKQSVHFVGQT